ncbi:MAG: hypothetical protein DRP45_04990 [Candidatus Zixiibacteriota bacterium]|nr:MAG: hypothetical protein DRP45_04990 [candidate division Zixibacteria bacterium]
MQWEVVNYLPVDVFGKPSETGCDELHCKFVVIDSGDLRHLVLGDLGKYPYHANLVDAFCTERDVPAAWVKNPDLVEVYDQDTEVLGGGMMQIDMEARLLKVYGSSSAYGGFKGDDLANPLESEACFSHFRVVFQ